MADGEATISQQVREARGKFAAMAGTYSLGVLNDNFFKQAACLLAVYVGKPGLQDTAAVIFTLPWLIFAAYAGWAADRFAKRHVVIFAKGMEVAAMICGGVGIILINWPLIMVMMFLMALQSTIFSPAINGSIPELYPPGYVIRANSRLKSLIMAGNLVGIILAGVILDIDRVVAGVELGRWIIGLGVICISILGVGMSLGVARKPAADPTARFPWEGPLNTLRELWDLRRDPLLATIVVADAFMWFIAVLQILLVNEMGPARFGFSERQTSYLLVAELGGVGAGAVLAGRFHGERWHRPLPQLMAGVAVFTAALACTPLLPAAYQLAWVTVGLVLAGTAGGAALIPMEAFFQIRPAPERKGAVIAAANFAGFAGMAFAGPVNSLARAAGLPPVQRFGVVAGLAVVGAGLLAWGLKRHGRREATHAA